MQWVVGITNTMAVFSHWKWWWRLIFCIFLVNISLNEKWWCYKDVFNPKAIQIETYSNFASNSELLFFLIWFKYIIISFFSLFNLKYQKKFESISLRISAKFELVITFVCCMYMFSRKLQSNQYMFLLII